MNLGIDTLALLFLVAFIAAFIDAIAGGGGLITIPALLMTGMSPAQALGTNKLQSCGGSFSASVYFLRQRAICLSDFLWIFVMIFIGSVLGTLLIQHLDASFIKKILPFFILAIGLYFLFTPTLGKTDKPKRVSYPIFALSISPFLGFYDGFFGPGTGSLMSLACITLLGFNLTKATVHAKIMNFTSNIASLMFFVLGSHIIWNVGLVMLSGSLLGANFGAKMAMNKGKWLIRPMVITMSFLMTLKIAYSEGWLYFFSK